MTYSTSYIQLNGEWRKILIISSKTPLYFHAPNLFVKTEHCGDVDYLTTYLTTGNVYREFHEAEKHSYWFLLKSENIQAVTTNEQTLTDAELALIAAEQRVTDLDLQLLEVQSQ